MVMTRRVFFNVAGATAFAAASLLLPGCGGSRNDAQSSSTVPSSASMSAEASSSSSVASGVASSASASAKAASDALVIYFSHTGENYGVGVIEEGNTAIIAKMVAEKTGADMFEVVPAEAYPEGYDECCDVALSEQHAGARPAYVGDMDISGYKTVYLGYPIWWGDLPMCLYTFLEAHDWNGKEIHPFCTHAGSGLSSTVEAIQATCEGANVSQGLAILGTTAQGSREEARASVETWLG